MYKKMAILLTTLLVIYGCTGKTSEELYAEGLNKLHEGNPNGAIVLFKNALDKDQNYLAARYQLAKAYVSAGKYELAEKEFQKIKRLNPSQLEVKLDLAKNYNFLRKPDLAITQAEEYLKAKPTSAEACETIGIAYSLKGLQQNAEEYLVQALQIEPGKVSAKLELAALFLVQRKIDEANDLLEGIIKIDAGNVRAYYLLADAEIALGKNEHAFAIYNKLMNINSNDPVAPYKAGLVSLNMGNSSIAESLAGGLIAKFPKKAEGYVLKGIIAYRNKNYLEATSTLQSAIKLQPNIGAYYFLGLSLYNQGQLENALSQFRLILDQSPSFHQARLLSGIILLKQKRYEDAIVELTRFLDSNGKSALGHNIIGSAYLAKGMYEEGMKELDIATRLDPKLIDAHLKKGAFHFSQGKHAEVESDLTTAIKIVPESLNTRLILAFYYMQRNNVSKAMSTLNEGLIGKKSDAVLYSAMAKIMTVNNKTPEAIRLLQKSKESDPSTVAPYFILATTYAAGGDIDKAANEYSEVLKKEPNNVKAILQLAVLAESTGNDKEAFSYLLKAKDTKNLAAYQALSRYLVRTGDTAKALSVLSEAAKNIPRSPEIFEERGRLHMKTKQYKLAMKTFDDLEAIAPERGISMKTSAYLAMNKHDEAIKQAQKAISLKPGSSIGFQLLASVYQAMNKVDAAIAELNKGLSRDGTNPQTALMLADLHAKSGNYTLAMKTSDDIIRKNPNFAPAFYAQGTFLEAQGDKKAAIKKYLAALTVSENMTAVLNNLAFLYTEGYGARDEALRMARKAYALDPCNPAIMDTLGYALYKNGNNQESKVILKRAETMFPGNPMINYHLALAHKVSGEKEQARSRLQLALRSGEFAESRQAQKLLTELN